MRIAPQDAPASQPSKSETPQAALSEHLRDPVARRRRLADEAGTHDKFRERVQSAKWAVSDALEKGAAATVKGAGYVAGITIALPAVATLTAIPGALVGGVAGAVLGGCVAGAAMLAGGDPALWQQVAQHTSTTCMAGGVVVSWVGFASGHLGFGGGD
jgi:hypothetical protein